MPPMGTECPWTELSGGSRPTNEEESAKMLSRNPLRFWQANSVMCIPWWQGSRPKVMSRNSAILTQNLPVAVTPVTSLVSVSPHERCHNHTAQEQPHQVCLVDSCKILDAGTSLKKGFQGFHNVVKRVASTADITLATPLFCASRASPPKKNRTPNARGQKNQGNAT